MKASWEPYDDLIARGLAAGEAFSQITLAILEAGRADTTRNAVIGRARRLGLESAVKPGCGQVRVARKRGQPMAQEPAQRVEIRKTWAVGKARAVPPGAKELCLGAAGLKTSGLGAAPRGARAVPPAQPVATGDRLTHVERFRAFRAAFLPPDKPVRLADIEAGACRRPVGGGWGADLLMCGARVRGVGSYCRACAKLIYAPRPEGAPVLPRLAGAGMAALPEPTEGEVDLVDQFGEGA
ncbi:GcrA family cell cycle regulator [Xanthobacter sp. VTT E-85241]|uniref:GcrA family cell cycle regulator n=1 Tax=Roseixanthobacter finlandensis TaxID=3119922 RepID=UPI00372C0E8D